ncbi:DNA-directed RNA polymerase subunit D [Candidatus Pacearchaeota archaeon]|nr:DNA-directed RNA polymerase subunit D [Candidatus Pacearchaeota archaeon]
MEIISKKENQIVFSAKTEESLANAIRRYLNFVPILAVDEVEISKNDSALYDETIANRIGLLSLKTEKSHDDKTKIEIKLSSKKPGFVKAGEFTGKAEVVYGEVPITFLNDGQEIEVVATAKLGKGIDHSKFSPGIMFYRNSVDIKIDKTCPPEVANKCPKGIFQVKDGKITTKDEYKCDLCEACTDYCKKKGKDAIQLVPKDELIITLESFGQLEVKEIFSKALDELKKDLKEFSKKVSK